MGKIEKIKILMKQLLQLESLSTTTEEGYVIYWEDALEVGTEVFIDEDGERKPIADGEFHIDGKKYSVSEGKVTEIEDGVAEEPKPEEEKPEEVKAEDEPIVDEPKEEPKSEEEPKEEPKSEEPNADIEALKAEIEEIKKMIEELKTAFGIFQKEPKTLSPTEQFEAMKRANEKADKREMYAEAIRNMRKK